MRQNPRGIVRVFFHATPTHSQLPPEEPEYFEFYNKTLFYSYGPPMDLGVAHSKGGEKMIQNVRVWLREVTELGLLLVALSVVLQILFGASVPFVGGDVVGNITGLIATLGQNGLVGLIAIAVILYLFQRRPAA